mgnify:CR=1 FL=1
MKIGIYGGSFNPPHLGHQNAAVEAAEKCALDKLLLIPAGIPPHKVMEQGSPANEHRLAMTRLMGGQAALQSGVEVEVLDLEMAREGKSYTVDTLRALRRQYPNDELLLFMGTDMFFSFESWRAPEEIAKLAKVVAFYRNADDTAAAFAAQAERLRARFGGSFEALALDRVIEASSTALRAGMASGTGEAMLEPQVCGYILREHLYGTNLDLKRLTVQQLRPIALSYLKAKRCAHVLGTAATAVKLAEKYGADVHRAEVAGLLHDCTKKLSMPEQLALCEKYGIALDALEKKALKLLHAKTGAALARDVFGVDDEIYNAILWHTTGKPDMTVLDAVVNLADYIEPTRSYPDVDEIRRLAQGSLFDTLCEALGRTMILTIRQGSVLHPDTLVTWNALILRSKAEKGEEK